MKILIIRFSSIGDIVLTTPVIRCLHNQVPGSEIHYLTKKQFVSLVETNPYVHQVHVLEQSFEGTISKLKAEHFDLILDLHRNLRTLRVKTALGVKSFSFNKLNIEKWLVTSFKWDLLPKIHIVDRYLETAQSLGVKNDGAGLDFFIPESAIQDLSVLPEIFRSGYYCFVIGAAHATKKLPPEKIIDIFRRVPFPVILIGGKDDHATGEIITTSDSAKIFNACGLFNLNQSASIVNQSRLVVSHDTGFMHIAAALKKKLIAVWGNTIPGFGMYPYFGTHEVPHANFEVNGLSCRPCSKIGYDKCPEKHFKCMIDQNTSAISETIVEYWDDRSRFNV